jgi:PHD/YefM family antitoxin component YafN of YafNO toxin-antitoxin module
VGGVTAIMENMDIVQAHNNFFDVADRVIEYDSVVNISTEKGNVIMLNERDYNGLMETLYLLSIPGNREKLLTGMNTPFEDCVELDWRNELNV